jgi:hypothetical protein
VVLSGGAEMIHVIVEDGMVVTVNVDKSVFPQSIKAPDDVTFGDLYTNGGFVPAAGITVPVPDEQPRPDKPIEPIEKQIENLEKQLSGFQDQIAELKQIASRMSGGGK